MGVQAEPSTAGPATAAVSTGKKRKRSMNPTSGVVAEPSTITDCDASAQAYNDLSAETPAKKGSKAQKDDRCGPEAEKRLRRFRAQPPQSFHDIYHRATTQRFYVLSRTRCGTADCPEELVELTGSTGNIYNVVIAPQPGCDCPHGREGNQCKHVLYVLSRVLRARFDFVYQLALLPSELREIFAAAPPPANGDAGGNNNKSASQTREKRRKPFEGDCPICFNELQEPGKEEAIVWCRAACGQNIHRECFEMWAATKRRAGSGTNGDVTCPFCRSVWEGDEDVIKKIKKTGKLNYEGYVNVADQLGIGTDRDISTYSRWWSGHPRAFRRRGYGSGY